MRWAARHVERATKRQVPNSLVLGFTTTNTGGTSVRSSFRGSGQLVASAFEATVGLPSGMLSDGQLTIAGARRLEEMDGWGDWEDLKACKSCSRVPGDGCRAQEPQHAHLRSIWNSHSVQQLWRFQVAQ